jgi:hypothetical protein
VASCPAFDTVAVVVEDLHNVLTGEVACDHLGLLHELRKLSVAVQLVRINTEVS